MSQPTIQSGTKSFADTLTSMTIVRGTDTGFNTTVDVTKTVLIVTWNTAGTNASNWPCYALRYVLTDGDTITIDRFTAPSDGQAVSVSWALYSFASGVTVQHKQLAATASGSGTVAITSVGADLTHTFLMPGGIVAPGVFPERNAVEWKCDSTTQISWARDVASGNIAAAVQVVTMDFATVQAVTVSATTSTATTFDTTISAVTVASSMIFGSVRITGTVDMTSAMLTASLTSTTNLRLSRNTGTSFTLNGTVYVVSFTDGTTVARYSPSHSAGTGTVDTTITAITLASTMLNPSAMTAGVTAGRPASAVMGRGLAVMTFTSTTNLRTVKGITNSAADYQVEVIGFAALAGPTIDTQPTAATARLHGDPTTAASFTVSATTSGGALSYQWQLEDSVGGGTYSDLSNGTASGITWSNVTTATVTATCSATTQTGKRVRVNVTDSNGTTTSSAVALTILNGPVLSAYSGTTNGSGVVSVTLTSDDALSADGEVLRITAVCGPVTLRTYVRPT